MFGKARAIESLIQNKAQVDEAVAAYQELNERFPHGMFKTVADQRLEQLQKKETVKFYESLAQYTPKPKVESPAASWENSAACLKIRPRSRWCRRRRFGLNVVASKVRR